MFPFATLILINFGESRWEVKIFVNWQAFSGQTFFGSKNLTTNFSVLMKCTNKFGCLVYEDDELVMSCKKNGGSPTSFWIDHARKNTQNGTKSFVSE